MIKKSIFIIVFLIFFITSIQSQNYQEIVIDKNLKEITIGESVYIYEDKRNSYIIEEIQKQLGEFRKSEKKIPNFGYTTSSYWIYFKLKNITKDKEKILLNLSYPLLDIVDFYLLSKDKIIKKNRNWGYEEF